MESQAHLYLDLQRENPDGLLNPKSPFELPLAKVSLCHPTIFFISEKFLGYVMKWGTSEPDSSKGSKSCEIYFSTVLNTLCKPLPMFCGAFNATFHSDCLCLIQ